VRACVGGTRTVKSKLVMNNTGKIKLHIIHRRDDNIEVGFLEKQLINLWTGNFKHGCHNSRKIWAT